MKDLMPRLLSGVVFIALMTLGILYNDFSLILLFGLITGIASWEYLNLILTKKNLKPLLLLAALGVFAATVYLSGDSAASLAYGILSLVLAVFAAWLLRKRKFMSPQTMDLMSLIYVALPFGLLALIGLTLNPAWVLGFFIMLWTNDSLAYVTGRAFGKNKLAPLISPKKTWEGFIGGAICTALVAAMLIPRFSDFSLIEAGLIGLVLSLSATAGDLVESVLKRAAGVKDSGKIMPGHGGLLDRFDGALLAAPAVFFLVYFIN